LAQRTATHCPGFAGIVTAVPLTATPAKLGCWDWPGSDTIAAAPLRVIAAVPGGNGAESACGPVRGLSPFSQPPLVLTGGAALPDRPRRTQLLSVASSRGERRWLSRKW